MKIVLLCVVALVMVVQLPREGDAVCCHGKGFAWNVRCKDCSKGTPFCARGKGCNIFGCNCMGGCREGPCPNHHVHEKPVYEAPAGREYESSYDSEPYGRESDMSAVDSVYDVPATVVSSDIDTDVSSDTVSDVSSDTVSEVSSSSDADTAPIDCTYGCYDDYASKEIDNAEDVISSADENGDGSMDIEEAERFLVKRGLATAGYRAKRSLRSIDLNNDNFISAEELELYE